MYVCSGFDSLVVVCCLILVIILLKSMLLFNIFFCLYRGFLCISWFFIFFNVFLLILLLSVFDFFGCFEFFIDVFFGGKLLLVWGCLVSFFYELYEEFIIWFCFLIYRI